MKQREIKFRSWNPKGYFEYWGIGDVEDNGSSGTFPTGRSIRFQHQQFTGLYDNTEFEELTIEEQKEWLQQHTQDEWKGKLVYEGDVVKMHQFLFDGVEHENEIIGVIQYSTQEACYILDKIQNKKYEEYTGYNKGEGSSPICDFYGLHDDSWEIIGNIFENPELLEQ